MTDIDVPDWVVADILSRYTALRIERSDELWPPEAARAQQLEDMKAALRAALSAWVVPKPIDWQPSGRKRVFIPDAPVVQIGAPLAMAGRWETSYYWRAELGGKTTNGSPPIEALYTLRQEKPE